MKQSVYMIQSIRLVVLSKWLTRLATKGLSTWRRDFTLLLWILFVGSCQKNGYILSYFFTNPIFRLFSVTNGTSRRNSLTPHHQRLFQARPRFPQRPAHAYRSSRTRSQPLQFPTVALCAGGRPRNAEARIGNCRRNNDTTY